MAAWRFWLIMITGAWIAASIDSIRFRKMNGKGSNWMPSCFTAPELMIIHEKRTTPNAMMKPHDPDSGDPIGDALAARGVLGRISVGRAAPRLSRRDALEDLAFKLPLRLPGIVEHLPREVGRGRALGEKIVVRHARASVLRQARPSAVR